MDFSIAALMDEDSCYRWLVESLHPDGLACPQCGEREGLKVHHRHHAPILGYRCPARGGLVNAFTKTAFHKTHYRPSELVLILRGVAQGVPTTQPAREPGRNRPHLPALRHRLQESAHRDRDPMPLDDKAVEADEMYQNAGGKGVPPPDPNDPPRRRANKRRGHGSFDNDRPPVAGVAGRECGRVRMGVAAHADGATLPEFVGGRPGR